MMTMKSKLDNNESGLTVPVKCLSAEIAALISVKRHVRVILEKKYWLIIRAHAIILKIMILEMKGMGFL